MKKILCWMLSLWIATALCACGIPSHTNAEDEAAVSDAVLAETDSAAASNYAAQPTEKIEPTQGTDSDVDVDLTVISNTVVYSELYNMLYYDPEHYIGKTVKMSGEFAAYQMVVDNVMQPDPVAYACIVSDATACCAEGMEFILEENGVYPEDYPALGAEITVTGEFQPYEKDGIRWYHLTDTRLELG